MDDALLGLSWSAVLAGWPSLFLSVADVRALAESRILEATGEALIPLSDLACLSDDSDRGEAAQALASLARLEAYPPFFALRGWHLYAVAFTLDTLPHMVQEEEPELTPYYQMLALEHLWERLGEPLDMPLLKPFIRSYVHLDDPEGGIALTVHELRGWILEQRTLLEVISRLLADGRAAEVAVLAAVFESAQANAAARFALVHRKLAIHQNMAEFDGALWEKFNEYNAATMERRRAQGKTLLGPTS